MESELSGDELPGLRVITPYHGDPGREMIMPDHGYAPECVYVMNALAIAGDKRVVPCLERAVGKLVLDPKRADSRICYAHCVAYAMDRLAAPEGAPVIERLLSNDVIRDHVVPRDEDPRRGVDPFFDRYSYLELCLGRALARCGRKRGYQVMIRYLCDQRLYLSRSALLELRDITGVDHGFDAEAWTAWLAKQPESLPAQPLRRRFY